MKISAIIAAILLPAASASASLLNLGVDETPAATLQHSSATTESPRLRSTNTLRKTKALATVTAAIAAQTNDNIDSMLTSGLVSIQSPTYSTLNTNVKYTAPISSPSELRSEGNLYIINTASDYSNALTANVKVTGGMQGVGEASVGIGYTAPISSPSELRSEGNLYIINTASDYSNALSANVKVTGGMQGVGEASVGVGYMSSVQVSDESTTWLVNQFQTFTQYYSLSDLDPAWINTIVSAYASASSAQDFVNAYGRYFLSGYKRGCVVSAKYSVACDSVASKQSFQASVSGSYSEGPFSVGTDSSFSTASSQSSSVCTTNGQAACTGVACDGLSISGVTDAVTNLATTCTPSSAALISGYFTPYISLPAFYQVAAKKGDVTFFTSDYTNQTFDPLAANLVLSDLNAQLGKIDTCLGSADSNGNYNKCYSRYRIFDRIVASNNVQHWTAVNQLASNGRALKQAITATFTTVGINADTLASATSQIAAFKVQLNQLLADGPAWKLQVYPIRDNLNDPNPVSFPTNADGSGALTFLYPGSTYASRYLSTPVNFDGCGNYYFGVQFDPNGQNPTLLSQTDCQGGVMQSIPLPLFDTSSTACTVWNGDRTECLQSCGHPGGGKPVCQVNILNAGWFIFSML